MLGLKLMEMMDPKTKEIIKPKENNKDENI